ncbi:type II secretory pathway component [Alkalimonas sp.]|uniref:type II secretory pathway component n=1 Tax=Alkalimonas sp. TaxID=1872453 RepID=UPI00263B2D61|nr:type II secretory pathway component [Alkalimonas sp.]MCC5826039.1 type II secretory pathway component [Alkalimonas sp.]
MYPNPRQHQGSALVVAIFVIVVIFGLLLAMSRILLSSSESVVYEVLGTRALLAAQSGLELAATQLFPLEQETASCAAVSAQFILTGHGLSNCRVRLSCSASVSLDTGTSQGQLFLLQSSGECRSQSDWSMPCQNAELCASRTVQMEVGF